MSGVVRALFTSHISETIQLHEGELWAADDQVVAAHPDWFSADLLSTARRTGPPAPAAAVEVEEPDAQADDTTPEENATDLEPEVAPAPRARAKRKYRTADEKVDI